MPQPHTLCRGDERDAGQEVIAAGGSGHLGVGMAASGTYTPRGTSEPTPVFGGASRFLESLSGLPAADQESLRLLDRESASAVWRALVSSDARERHPLVLPRGHWLEDVTLRGPDYRPYLAEGCGRDRVAEFLKRELSWAPESRVLFVWMREIAVSVPWAVLVRYWPRFLFSDHGPFVLSLEHPEFVAFGPRGALCVGKRRLPDARVTREVA